MTSSDSNSQLSGSSVSVDAGRASFAASTPAAASTAAVATLAGHGHEDSTAITGRRLIAAGGGGGDSSASRTPVRFQLPSSTATVTWDARRATPSRREVGFDLTFK